MATTWHYYKTDGTYLGTSKPNWQAGNTLKTQTAPVNGRMPAAEMRRFQGGGSSSSGRSSGGGQSGAVDLYKQRYGEALGTLDRLSGQERQDLAQRYGSLRSNAQNQLIGAGLQATTILPSVMSGITREQQSATNSLSDQLLRERLGIMGEYTSGQAGAMENAAQRNLQAKLAADQNRLAQSQLSAQMAMEQARLNRYSSGRYSSQPKANYPGTRARVTGGGSNYYTNRASAIKQKHTGYA